MGGMQVTFPRKQPFRRGWIPFRDLDGVEWEVKVGFSGNFEMVKKEEEMTLESAKEVPVYVEHMRRTAQRMVVREGRADIVICDVLAELDAAQKKFPPFNSAHEGYGVLEEERDELWDEIKAKQGARDVAAMRKEAVQVAAMAIRFIIDVCDNQKGQV